MRDSGYQSNKRVIIAIVITVIIILALIGGYLLYKNFENKKLNEAMSFGYSLGYNKSVQDVAQGQTQTGNIVVWKDNSVQVMKIQDICSGIGAA